MLVKAFPVIDTAATGDNIRRLRQARGLSVRDLQSYFGFEEPRAIYKWQKGECLPTVDNLYALGTLLEVPMEQILVPLQMNTNTKKEQQTSVCCSHHLPVYRLQRMRCEKSWAPPMVPSVSGPVQGLGTRAAA